VQLGAGELGAFDNRHMGRLINDDVVTALENGGDGAGIDAIAG
jgi:hypothetical protein